MEVCALRSQLFIGLRSVCGFGHRVMLLSTADSDTPEETERSTQRRGLYDKTHTHTHLPITVVRSACVCARMRVHEHKHLEPCLPVLGADNAAPPALVSLYCQASTYKTNPNPYPQTLVSVVTLRSGCRNPLK